mmetsp:Transcript_89147/g.240917  ORF Transcript_89147/g.240917 Transcript_89147/m.240917 type:complete len:111 (+) Transcript_89147:41-373(+)
MRRLSRRVRPLPRVSRQHWRTRVGQRQRLRLRRNATVMVVVPWSGHDDRGVAALIPLFRGLRAESWRGLCWSAEPSEYPNLLRDDCISLIDQTLVAVQMRLELLSTERRY